jgi:hypothetical protein
MIQNMIVKEIKNIQRDEDSDDEYEDASQTIIITPVGIMFQGEDDDD